jgi:hypothetical protein
MSDRQDIHTASASIGEPAGEEALRHILGDLNDARVLEILAIAPTEAELEEANLWASGEGDLLDRSGHPLVGNVALIYEILTRDEDLPDR